MAPSRWKKPCDSLVRSCCRSIRGIHGGRLLLLILLSSLLGCGLFKGEEINSRYVNSSPYTRFAKQLEKEQRESAQRRGSFRSQLQVLSGCTKMRRLSLPLHITNAFLKTGDNRYCQKLYTDGGRTDTLQTLGKTSFKNIEVLFVIRSQPSIYLLKNLFAATFSNQQLLDVIQVGQYRDNLSKKISTDIHVRKEKMGIYIYIRSHRRIRYPIRQKNQHSVTYLIDSKGDINLM